MIPRLSSLLALTVLLSFPTIAKDKSKAVLPGYVLHAQTAVVVVAPDAGEPLDQPYKNAAARDNVEKALAEWGRFNLVMDGQESDLIFVVRTGRGKTMQPTIKGGPIDQRPGYGQSTDSTIRIGGHQGTPPSTQDPAGPADRGPSVGNEIGPSEDMLEVYRGGISNPLDASPAWRYIKKDCLRATNTHVLAVEEFRKLIAEQEKAQTGKKP